MNGGPDVERTISAWLREEAPARAPDRILFEAGQIIDRTKQRRRGAAWREPMVLSAWRLVAAVVFVLAAIVGAGWIGRSTAPVSNPAPTGTPSPSPTVSPTPSPSAVSVVAYRAAHDAICTPASATLATLNPKLDGIYDPALTASQRAPKINAALQIADLLDQTTSQLAALSPPPDVAAEHAVSVARTHDVSAMIRDAVNKLLQPKPDLAGAKAVDLATGLLNGQIESFEQKYGLVGCP